MGTRTGIEYVDVTWNVTAGCWRKSAGCDHCYAERVTRRLDRIAQSRSGGANPYHDVLSDRGRWNGQIVLFHNRLSQPLSWGKPQRVFVNSLSDLFHERVPFGFIDKVFWVMRACPRHRFLVLTKRQKRMAQFVSQCSPLPAHIWLGVSLECTENAAWRLPDLLDCDTPHRFVSCEPLLCPLSLTPWLNQLAWVIAGPETGPRARPCYVAWLEELRTQCSDAGVPLFVKRLPKGAPPELLVREWPAELAELGPARGCVGGRTGGPVLEGSKS